MEIESIRIEAIMPNRILTLPEFQLNKQTIVEINIRITNQTVTPLRFNLYNSLQPELLGPNGKIVRGGRNSNGIKQPEESDFPLAMPGETISFFPHTILLASQNTEFVMLAIFLKDGSVFVFENLQAIMYQLRFIYKNFDLTRERTPQGWHPIENRLSEKVWLGRVDMDFLKFRILKT